MSDFFNDEPDEPQRPVPLRHETRRPRPLVLTLIVLAVLLVGFSLFAGIWTDKLWFSSVGYGAVFTTLVWTKIGMFLVFGALMALAVGGNLWIAYRLRPVFRASSPEQANLDRYRDVITPIRRVLVISVSLGLRALRRRLGLGQVADVPALGAPAELREDRPVLPQGHRLLRLHAAVDALPGQLRDHRAGHRADRRALVVHYVYGGIRLQARSGKVSGAAQAQLSVLLGVLVLLKGADYYLDRFDLTSAGGGLVTGMTYSRDHATLPAKNILMAIAVICALLFFANIVRRTWTAPSRRAGAVRAVGDPARHGLAGDGAALPGEARASRTRRRRTSATNIEATRAAYDLGDTRVTRVRREDHAVHPAARGRRRVAAGHPAARPEPGERDVRAAAAGARLLHGARRCSTSTATRSTARSATWWSRRASMHTDGLPEAQKNWANLHTVYTHGYGMIAAYGNQRDAERPGRSTTTASRSWAEEDIPPTGVAHGHDEAAATGAQIYFGENSPKYSIVGKQPGGKDVELDVPQGTGIPGQSKTSTYDGQGRGRGRRRCSARRCTR